MKTVQKQVLKEVIIRVKKCFEACPLNYWDNELKQPRREAGNPRLVEIIKGYNDHLKIGDRISLSTEYGVITGLTTVDVVKYVPTIETVPYEPMIRGVFKNIETIDNESIISKAKDYISFVENTEGNSNIGMGKMFALSEFLLMKYNIEIVFHEYGIYKFQESYFSSNGFTVDEYEHLLKTKYDGDSRNNYIGFYDTPDDTRFNRGDVFKNFTTIKGSILSESFKLKYSPNGYCIDNYMREEIKTFFNN